VIEATKQCEGQVVAKFLLRRYLGGDEKKTVFLTERADGTKAVIKLIPAEGLDAEKKLTQWKRAAELSHPHLLRLFEMGRCEMAGTKYVYVVMEYAEENLSEVLPERALTPEEARETLGPVLDVLGYLHGKGFIQGQLKPSNFLAVKDRLKLATDSARQVGEPYGKGEQRTPHDPPEKPETTISASADIWALGVTLVEVLTQRIPAWETSVGEPLVPASMAEPFREIARNCLRRDPNARWTVPQISARMKQSAVPAGPTPASAVASQTVPARNYGKLLAIGAAIVVVITGLTMLLRRQPSSSATATTVAAPSAKTEPAAPAPKPQAGRAAAGNYARASQLDQGVVKQADVVHQALPKISPSAQRTISGKIKLRIRVHVDSRGNVTKSDMVSAGPSKYFARLAMEAARDWKFQPAPSSGERRWMLHFDLTRKGTVASAEPVSR
jgi:TonB family protein